MKTKANDYWTTLGNDRKDNVEETCQSGYCATANNGQMEVALLGPKVPGKNHPKKDERIKERDKAISHVERQIEDDPEDGEIL